MAMLVAVGDDDVGEAIHGGELRLPWVLHWLLHENRGEDLVVLARSHAVDQDRLERAHRNRIADFCAALTAEIRQDAAGEVH